MDHSTLIEWKLWGGLTDFVCEIYRSDHAVGDKKDLGAYIVGLLISAGKIVNPLASLVIAIAVRKGLDKLCPATEEGDSNEGEKTWSNTSACHLFRSSYSGGGR